MKEVEGKECRGEDNEVQQKKNAEAKILKELQAKECRGEKEKNEARMKRRKERRGKNEEGRWKRMQRARIMKTADVDKT